MGYITENLLRDFAGSPTYFEVKRSYSVYDPSRANLTVFLSHSHKDKTLVDGFIRLLASQLRIYIYVDWQDSTMPRVTNRETADRIKKKINDLNIFMILATKNAMESKWVPWEIGLADASKPMDKIYLVPIGDSSGNYYGSEYLQLYKTLKLSVDSMYRIFKPNETVGVPLTNALK